MQREFLQFGPCLHLDLTLMHHVVGQIALAKAVAEEDVDPSIVKCDAVPIQVAVPMSDA